MAKTDVLSSENSNSVVKLELSASYDEEHPKYNNHPNQSTSAKEIKIGEIFHAKDYFKFVCSHCSIEFSLFTLFTAHSVSHLREIYSASIVTNPCGVSEIVCPETEIKTEDDFEYIDMNGIQPDCILENSLDAQATNLIDIRMLQQRKLRNSKKRARKKCIPEDKLLLHKARCCECYLCRATFSTAPDLRTHFRANHIKKIEYKDYKYSRTNTCGQCGQQFNNVPMYEKHRRWHKNELNYRPHQCDQCGKTFIERFLLERHQKLHKKSLTCEICHKSFNERYMANHLRRHTGHNRVQCTECGRFYSSNDKLKTHMLTHTGENPFECEYCHKRFRQSYSLTIHNRSHTGEYIHYCTPCKKGFGYRRELRKHNLRVHGIETIEESDPKLEESVEENAQQ